MDRVIVDSVSNTVVPRTNLAYVRRQCQRGAWHHSSGEEDKTVAPLRTMRSEVRVLPGRPVKRSDGRGAFHFRCVTARHPMFFLKPPTVSPAHTLWLGCGGEQTSVAIGCNAPGHRLPTVVG